MPKSKRSKLVSLTQTDKKGRDNKERIFDEVRSNLDTFRYAWLLNLDGVRNQVLQELRSEWAGSKLIMGKQRVLQKALGDTIEEEYKENSSQLSKLFDGVVGILFTDEEPKVVKDYFESYSKNDYARANSKSPIDFTIPQGIVYSRGGQIAEDEDIPMQHTMDPTMRNTFKLPTTIKKGKIFLEEEYPVCEKGETLDVRKALILKQFGVACSEFKVGLLAYYDNKTTSVEKL
ncbi:Mrt4 protein [Saccharomycopsis crataegensis]|uniref:Ribosome assembly factor mrt4 n=1 Tax=Saccharomycopsis crataegensis TaxID=43959 RepID=A0AAV5QF32_9ASCO|nr:Mrt4 protein [Saccharomycopsis crataegensis]